MAGHQRSKFDLVSGVRRCNIRFSSEQWHSLEDVAKLKFAPPLRAEIEDAFLDFVLDVSRSQAVLDSKVLLRQVAAFRAAAELLKAELAAPSSPGNAKAVLQNILLNAHRRTLNNEHDPDPFDVFRAWTKNIDEMRMAAAGAEEHVKQYSVTARRGSGPDLERLIPQLRKPFHAAGGKTGVGTRRTKDGAFKGSLFTDFVTKAYGFVKCSLDNRRMQDEDGVPELKALRKTTVATLVQRPLTKRSRKTD